jgi:hypothetical protein
MTEESQRLAEEARSNLRALGLISVFRDKLDLEVAGDFGEKIHAALDHLASLAQPADLARDAERLDWLETNFKKMDRTVDAFNRRVLWRVKRQKGSHWKIRDAIDAAIQSATPSPEAGEQV